MANDTFVPIPAAAASSSLGLAAAGGRNGLSFAPGAKTPWKRVKFILGGGTRLASRRSSSIPVKSRCVVPSGRGRFIRYRRLPSGCRRR